MGEQDDAQALFAGEALRLVGVVQDWARETLPAGSDEHGGPECRWCPVCRFAAILRGDHPEITERVTEAGLAVASVLRAMLDTSVAATKPPAEPRPPRVQRIDLGGPGE